jgi:hypothetical protein
MIGCITRRKLFFTLCFIINIFLLVSCSPYKRIVQGIGDTTLSLAEKQTVGQTLVARYAGLSGIEVYVNPKGQTEGKIRLHLKASPQSAVEIAQSGVAISDLSAPGFYRFTFPPIAASSGTDYFFYIETIGSQPIEVATAPNDQYLDGAAYIDQGAVDKQLSFALLYDPPKMAIGLLLEMSRWLGLILIAVLLFVLPGWAIMSSAWPGWTAQDWVIKLTLSLAISLAIYPLFFLWTYWVNLRLGVFYAVAPPVISILYMLWKIRKQRFQFTFPKFSWQIRNLPRNLSIIFIIGCVIFSRLWVIRGLDYPLWGDSYHHTMIAQLIMDNGGLFDSWAPYADLNSLTYHIGFHTFVAVFDWVTRLPMVQSILWVGQLMNIAAVLVLYPLAVKLGRSPWAGAVALLVAGLLSPMPMFYTNWSRYTQLAGQVLLPIAIWMVWEAVEQRPRSIRPWIAVGLVWAGMVLVHYRVFMIAFCFLPVLLLYQYRSRFQVLKSKGLYITAGAGLILLLPWFYRVAASQLMAYFTHELTTPVTGAIETVGQYDLYKFLPVGLWLLFAIALATSLWFHEHPVLLIFFWGLISLIAANPAQIGLPGQGIITIFTLLIFAYFWGGIIIGAATGNLLERLPVRLQSFYQVSLVVVTLIAAPFSMRSQMKQINPNQFQMFTRADARAAQWIQANISGDARFLVNSMFAYENTIIVGTDGGWWLPLVAGRSITVPPMLYPSEKGPFDGYTQWVNQLPAEIQSKGLFHPDVLKMLAERKVNYVYIGQQQGSVNSGGEKLLNPEEMLMNSHFNPVYHQDRVWIFSIRP